MSSWCRSGRDWVTRNVQWRWRLERSNQQPALSQWSLTVRRYSGQLNQTATLLLPRVETHVGDPIITDHTTMIGGNRRVSEQLYCVLALTCRKRALQFPRGYGFEAWRQLCRKFEPHPVRFRGMLQVFLSSTTSAELKWLVRQCRNRGKVCEEQSGDEVSDWQSARPTTRDRARLETAEFPRARQARAVSGNTSPTGLVLSGSGEGDESAKPKEYFSWKKPVHSKGECRYFSAVREKRLVQQDRHRRGSSCRKGRVSVRKRDKHVEHRPRARCLPLSRRCQRSKCVPMSITQIDRGSDDLEDLSVLPCHVCFDTEAPEVFERDGLDTIAATEQHLRTLARSEVRIE